MIPTRQPSLIALVTDFGVGGIYTGQMEAVLLAANPGIPVIELISDLPPFKPRLAAYLLAALVESMPRDILYLCVVDPGVGSDRRAMILEADGQWFVGPDNGLLAIVARRARSSQWWWIERWPESLSDSFHGRDLFAPVAAVLARGEQPPNLVSLTNDWVGRDWPEDLSAVVYVDGFGNLVTGLRAERLDRRGRIDLQGHRIAYGRTFAEVLLGRPFWYANSSGLLEIAVNQGRADALLGLTAGDPVAFAAEC